MSISKDLLDHLKKLFVLALEDTVSNDAFEGLNAYTFFAVPSYIIAVTVVEAFMNEMFVSQAGRTYFKGSEPNDFWRDIEKKELMEKLVILPEKYFGCSLSQGEQPFQDMKVLVDLRNDLVHYKMNSDIPRYTRVLQTRKITLDNPGHLWAINVSTLEGIRWAHNTICQTMKTIGNCGKQETHPLLASFTKQNVLDSFPNSFIRDWLTGNGITVKE